MTRPLLVILAAALVVRLAAIGATPGHELVADPADYARHGFALAHGDGYPQSIVTGGPTAIRPPAFPMLLAAVFGLSGDHVGVARVVQALIGVAVVALVALVAARLWDRRMGLTAGALAAVFPPFVVVGVTLFSEPLFVALELAAILAVLAWRAAPRTRLLVAAGALLGLAILTRTTGVLVLLPLLFAVWRPPGRPRSLAAPAIVAACAALVVAPWTIRNAVVMDAFVPVSDQDGYTLVGTYNEESRQRGGEWLPTGDAGTARFVAQHRALGEVRLGRELRSRAREYALDHPGYLLTVLKHNAIQLFSLNWEEERIGQRVGAGLSSGWAALAAIGLLPFLLLALVGIASGRARGAPPWLWAIPILLLAGVVMVVGSSRFRAPADPFLVMLAAAGALSIADRVRLYTRRRESRRGDGRASSASPA